MVAKGLKQQRTVMEMSKPKVITMSGSTKYIDLISVVAWILECDWGVITMGMHLLPDWYGANRDHQAEHEGMDKDLDRLHFRKIDLSDVLYVVDPNGYIGESTAKEVKYAVEKGLQVILYSSDIDMQCKIAEILEKGK